MRKLSMSLRGTVLVASVSFIAFSFAVSQQAAQKKNQLSSVIDVILQTSDEKWKTLLDTVIRNCAKENANETTREACGLIVDEWDGNSSGEVVIDEIVKYKLVSVVDGDTIKIEKDGKEVSIRMIGIDAPESNTARYGYTECYGKEAKEYLEKLLTRANTVQIEMDASQGATDKYGRLLGYVFYDDENINKKMITEGYAREYTYDGEYKYKKEFDEAEKYARKRVNGLRYVNTCGGVRVSTDEQKAQKEKEEAERKVEQEKYLKEYEAKEVERKRQEALNNSSSYSSSSNSSSSSSSKCSGHIWHTGPKGGCYYNAGSSKVYDTSKICCS